MPPTRNRRTLWECICDCGARKVVPLTGLRRGTRSCGCKTSELIAASKRTHSDVGSPEYMSWANMRSRCSDPKRYRYGERGIKVCERWNDYEAFLADMGRRPGPGYSIDRIDNDGDYEPGNCRWSTMKDQCRNRRNTRRHTFGGESLTIAEWAARLGVNENTLTNRVHMGWTVERILTTPIKSTKRRVA